MHEVVFGIAGSAGLLVFTVLLELRVEGVLDTTWVLPFGFLWVTLAVYFVWIAQFFHARPRHWAVATIAIGVVLVAQAVGVPLVLRRLGVDPALAGGVVLTTVTDTVGFASLLGLGTLFLT